MRSERNMERDRNVSKFGTFKKITKWVFLTITAMLIVFGGYIAFKLKPTYDEMSAEADEIIMSINDNTFKRLDPTVVVRKDDTVVREFEHAPYEYIKGDEVSEDIKNSFISIEDKRFYKHKGVDLKANLRAVKALIDNDGEITQGASTITQQLVKNIFLTNEQTYERKIKEILIARRIEREFTKDEILEYYINNIYFANGVYGIETASEYYFSKNSNDLSLSEVAFLVSVPNNPTLYDPINNKDNTIRRRNIIINQMFEDEVISEERMNEEVQKDVELEIKPKSEYVEEDYEVTFIMSSAVKLIMEDRGFKMTYSFDSDEERDEYRKRFSESFEEVNEEVRAGGYKIVSTIDPEKQSYLQTSINNELSDFSKVNEESGIYQTQSAGVSIDNETGELVAIVGGRTQDDVDNTFNRAFLAYRQPASAIKPIVSYGPEIDEGLLGEDILVDEKKSKGPQNVTRSYQGNVTVREALERSINTIPFELMRKRGTEQAREYMANLEFESIVDSDSNAGLSIGGFTYGTSPLEMGGAYATLANNGKYIKLTGIDEIIFNNKESVYKNEKKEREIYKDGTTYLVTDMLKGVMTKKHGTGYKRQLGKQPSAGKSGTSSDNKDGWFAGYTPYYTTVIWVGNDDATPLDTLYGSTYPGRIWKNYMLSIHEELEVKDFEAPEGTGKMYLNPSNRYVSEEKKSGYSRYEIIPAHYRAKMEEEERQAIRKARIAREKAEREERIAREKREKAEREERERVEKAERERKAKFKEKYGVDEDTELANQAVVEDYINSAMNSEINSQDDYLKSYYLLKDAEKSLGNLVVVEDATSFQNRINGNYPILEKRREEMIARIEEDKLREKRRVEEERLKREAEIKAKEERLEEQKRVEEERIRKEAEAEEERKRQEELEKEQNSNQEGSNENNESDIDNESSESN